MNPDFFSHSLGGLRARRTGLVNRPNAIDPAWFNGIFERYVNPVITADHVLLSWRYDLDERSNPYLLESLGVNAASCAPAGVD
ncbi:MAG: hypothetical protein BGO12_23700 [Verrucomicrobia bacterium 61-8]|nr:hypothetical protein [Verrucomicrobiota bacterium]OJV17766.1 MAG: hypothetical protein BGO12_23700 [Verrucomicrobia bacterium 61-8]